MLHSFFVINVFFFFPPNNWPNTEPLDTKKQLTNTLCHWVLKYLLGHTVASLLFQSCFYNEAFPLCSLWLKTLLLNINLGLFPHHLEICLNVTCFMRSFLIIQCPPASLSPLLYSSITFIVFQDIFGHSLGSYQRGGTTRAGITSFVMILIPRPEKAPHT